VNPPAMSFFHPALRRLSLLLLGLSFWATPVLAHPGLDEGKRLVTELEFDAALAAFQGAIDSGELSREELLELLSERTLILHALHRESELVADFVWLAALAPEFILDMRAPPALVAAWKSVRDQARGPLHIRLVHELSGSELRVRAELTGTVPEGVRTRIGVRRLSASTPEGELEANGDWEVQEGAQQLVDTQGQPLTLDLFGEARGLGGLLVAQDGSPDDPRRITVDPRLGLGGGAGDLSDDPTRRRRRAWIIGSSAVVVVAAAALTSFFLLRGGEDEKPQTNITPLLDF
jgi:hypothetical protein